MSDIYLSLTETPSVVTLSQPVVSGALAGSVTVTNVVSVSVLTMPAINVTAAAPAVTTVAGTVVVSNFPAVTTVAGTVALDASSLSALEQVTVTVGAAVTVAGFSTSSLPPSTVTVANTVTINGTVTANVLLSNINGAPAPAGFPVVAYDETISGGAQIVPVQLNFLDGTVEQNNPLPISGTVTANGFDFNNSTYNPIPLAPFDETVGGGKAVVAKVVDSSGNELNWSSGSVPISGTVTANVFGSGFLDQPYAVPVMIDGGDSVTRGLNIGFHEDLTADEFRTVKASEPFPVQIRKGTVTIGANPSGALTTRFGSVTTANTAQITSAVTNASRKYLLTQNISAGTVTIGIGFSPTTTQGIQLTAGAGLTFDAFCPTGAVYWLGAVTGAAFTILEG